MNTEHKPVKVLQCSKCSFLYLMVGSVPVGIAERRQYKPRQILNMRTGNVEPESGTCPNHRRAIGDV